MLKEVIISFSFLVVSPPCSATVTIEKYKTSNEVTIRIHHEIIEEDIVEFKNAIEAIEKEKKILHMNAVQLNSRGGSGNAGRVIGKMIKDKKWYTYVSPKSKCVSACVFILMGGVVRYPFGAIGVHRSTFTNGMEVDDSKLEGFVKNDIRIIKEFAVAIGMTNQLIDSILNTESWRVRYLTDQEKRQWQVFGTDRIYEERLFTSIAKEAKIEREKFINVFRSNYEDCLKEAKSFDRTAYDCAKTKEVKNNYWNVLRILLAGEGLD